MYDTNIANLGSASIDSDPKRILNLYFWIEGQETIQHVIVLTLNNVEFCVSF